MNGLQTKVWFYKSDAVVIYLLFTRAYLIFVKQLTFSKFLRIFIVCSRHVNRQ